MGAAVGAFVLTTTPAYADAYYHIYGTWPENQAQSCYYAEYYHPDPPGHPDFCSGTIGVPGSISLYIWY
jgi:hypothetical protein